MVILERLARQIAPAVKNAQLYDHLRQSESELRKLSRAVEQSPSSVVITDLEGKIQYFNPKFAQITGYSSEVIGRNLSILESEENESGVQEEIRNSLSAGLEWHGQLLNRKKDGTTYWSQQSLSPVRDAEGLITHYLSLEEDITQQKQLEEQLLQAQKLESVGRLAGGIAHDFNNSLTPILGYAQLGKRKLDPADSLFGDLNEIQESAERASN